jgi:hypothetical protein
MNKIKLTPKNSQEIDRIILLNNGNNVKHPATAAQLMIAAKEAEDYLQDLKLSGYDRQGAKVFFISKSNTCLRKKIGMNHIVLYRGARAWFIERVGATKTWNKGKKWTIQLTKEQDELCIKNMRKGYTIEKPVFKL